MNKIIQACVKYLNICRPYKVSLQSTIKNPNWIAYAGGYVDSNGRVLNHDIRITMEDIDLYDLNTVIAHEFVHCWQLEYGIKGKTHGKRFQNMALSLREYLAMEGFDTQPLYRPDIDIP